jgi:hypothetical protein
MPELDSPYVAYRCAQVRHEASWEGFRVGFVVGASLVFSMWGLVWALS